MLITRVVGESRQELPFACDLALLSKECASFTRGAGQFKDPADHLATQNATMG